MSIGFAYVWFYKGLGDANQLAGLTLIDSLTFIGLQTLVF